MHLQPRLLLPFLILAGFYLPDVAAQQPPRINLQPRVVASGPGLPAVRITVDQRRVPLGTRVTFTLGPASVIRDRRYSVILDFGDRQRQIVQATEIFHLYQAVGTYTYSVVVKSSGDDPNDPAKRPPQVTLSAAPVPVDPGQSVGFAAQLSWDYPNIQYRFVYGDGNVSGWQTSSRSSHAYQKSGTYLARVDIAENAQQLGVSPRKKIEVAKAQQFSVFLSAQPSPVRVRQPALFVASAFPASPNTRYRFTFGDSQSTTWQSNSQARHVFDKAGSYRAYVEAQQFDNGRSTTANSTPTVVSVQRSPTPNPPPTPTPEPSPRPSPVPSPSPDVSPTPSPDASPSPTDNSSPAPSPTGSSSPFGATSPSPEGSTSPGDGVISSTSPGPNASPSNESSRNPLGSLDLENNWWKYLIIAAIILFLIYQVSMLFVAQPTFAAFSDPGVAAVAEGPTGLPIDFQIVLNRNVSTGSYTIGTQEPSLVVNADRLDERQTFEI